MKQVVVLSLSASVIALMLAGYSLLNVLREPSGIPPGGLEARLDQLREQGDNLSSQLQALRGDVAGLSSHVARAARSSASGAAVGEPQGENRPGPVEEIISRLEELAARLEATAGAPRSTVAALPGTAQPETPNERKRIVAGAQEVALDRSRSAGERIEALRELRFRDGRSRDITLAMIEVLQDSNLESPVRADIIRNLDGVTFEELKQPLLAILQADPDAETREETIETLQVFYDDPAVHAAVVQASTHDQNLNVRAEALRRLAQFGARRTVDGAVGTR